MKWFSRWEVFALASAFFAGLTALFGKIGVADINSNFATLIRTFTIIVVTSLILFFRHEWQRPETIGVKTCFFLILSGIATGLSWLCYYRALQLGPVSKVASIDKLSVAFAILLGIIFLGEKFTWPLAVGAGLIILGAVVVIFFR